MCTAIKHGCLVGRNLDVYESYGEEIIVTPRSYTLALRKEQNLTKHYAIIGMGTVSRGYPLYYDAANERGLYMAGLNYVGNAKYLPPRENMTNLAPFELIPYVLGKCKTTDEAERELGRINLTDIPFSRDLGVAQLHWFIADKERTITVEPDENGINIYNNPIGVLTNNPHFPYQLFNLNNFMPLSDTTPENTFTDRIPLFAYSEGMGAIGLPGDMSSISRFVRATYHLSHSRDLPSVSSLMHLLSSVEMPNGSVKVKDFYERTEYTSLVNLSTMTYYYRAYESTGTAAVKLFSEDLDASILIRHPIISIAPCYQN